MDLLEAVHPEIGVKTACAAVGLPRSSFYRLRRPQPKSTSAGKRVSARALSAQEKQAVSQQLNSARFVDAAPREVYAKLLDEGTYLCHWRTMYRLLAEQDQVRERRSQKCNPRHKRPELGAYGPNQLWSWDISKFHGPEKWHYFYLYTIVDVYSRFVPGWMVADKENAELAEQLIFQSCVRQGIAPGQLTLHADRGAPMTACSIAQLLADLHVTKTHARPYTPDDNPYSEAHFKTLKYRPDYPGFFLSLAEARRWSREFFHWYNFNHHHSGIQLLTPAVVHYGLADRLLSERQTVLQQAYFKHPERFVGGLPHTHPLPDAVWINPPKEPAAVAAVREAVGNPELAQGYPQIPNPMSVI
jgi:putative transposase